MANKEVWEMTDGEFRAYLQQKGAETVQFLQAVKAGLEAEGPVTTPERFDQIADQIEDAAPSLTAAHEGIRALGKLYSESRRNIKHE